MYVTDGYQNAKAPIGRRIGNTIKDTTNYVVTQPVKDAVKDTYGVGTVSGGIKDFVESKNSGASKMSSGGKALKGALKGSVVEIASRAAYNVAKNLSPSNLHKFKAEQKIKNQ